VDVARKRIALTMKDQSKPAQRQERREQQPAANKQPTKPGAKPGKPEPLNAFQAKLMELKKKFKD
jgi:protein Tex